MAGGGESGIDFPDTVLETIFAKIPFPEVFNVRRLSKHWKTHFSRITREVSTEWPKFFPVLLDWPEEVLVGYNSDLDYWKRIGAKKTLRLPDWLQKPVAGCGVLFVKFDYNERYLSATVCNLLTEKKKRLYVGETGNSSFGGAMVNCDGAHHYDLVVFQVWCTRLRVHVYKSISGTWMRRDFEMDLEGRFKSYYNLCSYGAFMDGSMYTICYEEFDTYFVGFNVESGAVTTIPLIPAYIIAKCAVVRCGSKVLVVILEGVLEDIPLARVMQFEPDITELVELSCTALTTCLSCWCDGFAASSDSIWVRDPGERVLLTYHVETRSWSSCNTLDPRPSHPEMDHDWVLDSFALDLGLQDPFIVP